MIQATYAHYAGKYSEAQFASNTNVGNPSRTLGRLHGPAGQGLDFAPGFDPANYETVLGIFPTANVFFEDGLSAPVTSEFTTSLGDAARARLREGHLRLSQHVAASSRTSSTCDTGSTDVTFEGEDFGTFSEPRLPTTPTTPERRYQGLVFQGRYRLTPRWTVYGNSTVQLTNEGNFEGEGANQPGVSSVFGDYPEAFNLDSPLSRSAGWRLPASQDAAVDDLRARASATSAPWTWAGPTDTTRH